MADIKKWSVTYTKHIKQKRKVYQDGFLELHSSSNKVKLYDDCENLLGSRFLKKDDVLSPCETILFDAYLVDIGDAQYNHKPMSSSNLQGSEKQITKDAGPLHGEKSAKDSFSVGRNTKARKCKATASHLSPSQKIIREFKKNEMKKYATFPDSPKTVNNSTTEWQVLYTTQITQKAKKFHDGFLQHAIGVSLGRQVNLFDRNRRLLESKFLRRDEIVRSGESLSFDGYLVEIGECEGGHNDVVNMNAQRGNSYAVESIDILRGSTLLSQTNSSLEWDAMYTSQVTQKMKKYHTGTLRLASCGPNRMKVTLLTEDDTLLSNRFLKLSEDVKSGISFEFPNYLVEVGEPRTHCKEKSLGNDLVSGNRGIRSSSSDNIKLNNRVKNTPLRDAHEILTVLKKPINEVFRQPVKLLCSQINVVDVVEEKSITVRRIDGDALMSKEVENNILIESIKSIDPDNGTEQGSICSTSCVSFRPGPSDIPTSLNSECAGSVTVTPNCNLLGAQVLDTYILESDSDYHQLTELGAHVELKRNVNVQSFPELISFKGTLNRRIPAGTSSDYSSSQLCKEVVLGCLTKHFPDDKESDFEHHKGNLNSDVATSSSNDCIHDPCCVDKEICVHASRSKNKIDQFPSFDLGF